MTKGKMASGWALVQQKKLEAIGNKIESASIRDKIWKRDKGTCQKCGRKLYKLVDPYEEVIEELTTLKEIPIFKWIKSCWKCNKETTVVSYDFAVGGYNYHIGSIEKLDKTLMQRYPFVKLVFSKTMGSKVVANTCVNCGALQGNWFIMEDLIKIKNKEKDTNKLIDIILPNNLKFEDLLIEKKELEVYEEKLSLAHVHHKDENRKNDDLDNLILLCRNCHIKIHSELRKM